MSRRSVAVIGGGIQGSLAALEAADLGRRVALFEATDGVMSRASRWNEGKLHLGFTYANDPSRRSAKTMVHGSFAFVDRLTYLTGSSFEPSAFSEPFTFLVHGDGLLTVEATGVPEASRRSGCPSTRTSRPTP